METENTSLRERVRVRKLAERLEPVEIADEPREMIAAGPNGRKFSPEFVANTYRPGQSGNPNGRPKRKGLEEILRDHLEKTIPIPGGAKGEETTRLELMAKVLFSEGITKRNSKVMLAIFDRLWPKPIKIQGDPESPLLIARITRTIVDASRPPDS